MKTAYNSARAKLNLYLRITGKRDDGYHTLETVFQSVRLRDDIMIHMGECQGIEVRTNKSFLPSDSRNLAHRAAELFFEESGKACGGVRIHIKKRIPVGGGMGGGSADAAAVLRTLNQELGRPIKRSEILNVALKLGADVPFCIMNGAALARGIGEQLERIPAMPNTPIVGCRPGVSVSTEAAFRLFDEWTQAYGSPPAPEVDAMVRAMRTHDLRAICAAMHNDFEAPVMLKLPKLAEVKAEMLKLGALGALMTGSGSVIFGVFDDKDTASAAAEALKKHGEVFSTYPFEK